MEWHRLILIAWYENAKIKSSNLVQLCSQHNWNEEAVGEQPVVPGSDLSHERDADHRDAVLFQVRGQHVHFAPRTPSGFWNHTRL